MSGHQLGTLFVLRDHRYQTRLEGLELLFSTMASLESLPLDVHVKVLVHLVLREIIQMRLVSPPTGQFRQVSVTKDRP